MDAPFWQFNILDCTLTHSLILSISFIVLKHSIFVFGVAHSMFNVLLLQFVIIACTWLCVLVFLSLNTPCYPSIADTSFQPTKNYCCNWFSKVNVHLHKIYFRYLVHGFGFAQRWISHTRVKWKRKSDEKSWARKIKNMKRNTLRIHNVQCMPRMFDEQKRYCQMANG